MQGGHELKIFEYRKICLGIKNGFWFVTILSSLNWVVYWPDKEWTSYFISFLDGTQNGYYKKSGRHCAQARAIENECFVSIAGSVETWHKGSTTWTIPVLRSRWYFTALWLLVPANGIKAEATSHTKWILIADCEHWFIAGVKFQFGSVSS